MTTSIRQLTLGLAAIGVLVASPQARQATHAIDARQSKLLITVGKSGLFGAFGHNHVIEAVTIAGSIHYDASDASRDAVSFSVNTASLHVIDPGESDSDREHVQATMLGSTVLDADHFPVIAFTTTGVSSAKSQSAGWDGLDLAGVLKLHGVERPLRVPVQLRVEGNALRVRGEVAVRQTDFGMTPVTAAGGTVRVKDEVKITFEIVATRGSQSP